LDSAAAIEFVSTELGLGDPCAPELYRRPETVAFGSPISQIRGTPDHDHPAFSRRSGQPPTPASMHSTGDSQDPGYGKT
jgi:hypothetical protein